MQAYNLATFVCNVFWWQVSPRAPLSYCLQVQRVQRELKKLGVYFSPQSTSHNAVGHLGSDLAAPDRSQGKLRFSLLYNRKRLELHLTVTEALDLPSQGYTKTFIQARLLSGVSTQTPDLQHIVHEWQTRVVKNCSSPTFGEQFVCTLQETELAKSNLKLEVRMGVIPAWFFRSW